MSLYVVFNRQHFRDACLYHGSATAEDVEAFVDNWYEFCEYVKAELAKENIGFRDSDYGGCACYEVKSDAGLPAERDADNARYDDVHEMMQHPKFDFWNWFNEYKS